jgi:DNA-binding PadR family transcriptional regulator
VTELREPAFLILTALADRPRHGYGVIQEVSALSGGRVSLLPGTVYTALDRLTAQGLVALDREEVVDGRKRRYYRLTPPGTALLRVEAARLREMASSAEAKLRLVDPSPRPGVA